MGLSTLNTWVRSNGLGALALASTYSVVGWLGTQLAFFLLQGLAVAVTLRLRPRGAAAVVCWAGTLAFNLATSVVFLADWDEVTGGKYYDSLPRWLGG